MGSSRQPVPTSQHTHIHTHTHTHTHTKDREREKDCRLYAHDTANEHGDGQGQPRLAPRHDRDDVAETRSTAEKTHTCETDGPHQDALGQATRSFPFIDRGRHRHGHQHTADIAPNTDVCGNGLTGNTPHTHTYTMTTTSQDHVYMNLATRCIYVISHDRHTRVERGGGHVGQLTAWRTCRGSTAPDCLSAVHRHH
jgi:hypothetical protein